MRRCSIAPATGRSCSFCDHAGRRVPKALGDLGLDATAFERHIAWDIGAADCARHLARTLAAPLILAAYSRLVIDPNRQTADPTSIPEVSDETTIPANIGISPEERAARIAALHVPYHNVVDDVLSAAAARRTRADGGFGAYLHAGVQGLRAAMADRACCGTATRASRCR